MRLPQNPMFYIFYIFSILAFVCLSRTSFAAQVCSIAYRSSHAYDESPYVLLQNGFPVEDAGSTVREIAFTLADRLAENRCTFEPVECYFPPVTDEYYKFGLRGEFVNRTEIHDDLFEKKVDLAEDYAKLISAGVCREKKHELSFSLTIKEMKNPEVVPQLERDGKYYFLVYTVPSDSSPKKLLENQDARQVFSQEIDQGFPTGAGDVGQTLINFDLNINHEILNQFPYRLIYAVCSANQVGRILNCRNYLEQSVKDKERLLGLFDSPVEMNFGPNSLSVRKRR